MDDFWLSKSSFFSLNGFSSHSSWLSELSEPILRLEKLYYSIETCKNIKIRLVCGIFFVLHLEIANLQNGTNLSSTRRSSPVALSQGVLKRTKLVHWWRALTRVYDVPFWYLPTFLAREPQSARQASELMMAESDVQISKNGALVIVYVCVLGKYALSIVIFIIMINIIRSSQWRGHQRGLASNQALPALDTSHARCCYWRRLLGKGLSRAVVVNSNMSRGKYLAREGPGSRLQRGQATRHSMVTSISRWPKLASCATHRRRKGRGLAGAEEKRASCLARRFSFSAIAF